MTEAVGYRNKELYYQPSGQLNPPGLVLGIVGGLAIALAAALAYGYAVVHIPIAGWVTFLLAAAFGAAMGFGTAKLLALGKVRNQKAAITVVLGVSLVGYYVSWAAWIKALAGKLFDEQIPLIDLVSDPGQLWATITAINETGWVEIGGLTPSGGILWALWVGELIIIFASAIVLSMAAGLDRPFCEHCQRWCESAGPLAHLDLGADDVDDALRMRLESRDLDALVEQGETESDTEFYRVELHSCPQCSDTNTLSVDRVTVKIDKDGDRSEETETIVDHLLLGRDEAETVRQLPQELVAPPAASAG